MRKTSIAQTLQDLFEEYLGLGKYDVDRKSTIEWEFEDLVYREVFQFNGVDVEVTDQSIEDNEVTIISLEGIPIHHGNDYLTMNVPEFIKNCCN